MSGVDSPEPPGSVGVGFAGAGAGRVELRKLELRDLNDIERIERES